MCPYTDLHVMSVIRGSNEDSIPRSFTVLAGRMADGDDHKGGLISIITFNQGKCTLREQTLARLVLGSTRSALIWFADGVGLTNWEKSSWTFPS